MEKSWVKKLSAAVTDERGIIVDVFDGKNIEHIGFITSKKGTTRGNHYHKEAGQYTYILKGRAEWYTKDMKVENSPVEKAVLEAGDLAYDAPYIAHAIVALEDTDFIFFTDKARFGEEGYEKDTFRVKISE